MKTVLVIEANRAVIVTALATARCAVSYETVAAIAAQQEKDVVLLLNAKTYATGAVATHVLKRAKITMRRGGAGWYLVDVKASRAADSKQLTLTEKQHLIACADLRRYYSVAPALAAKATTKGMKPLAITASNRYAIAAALNDANGNARAHTVTTYLEVEDIANRYERTMRWLTGEKRAAGATLSYVSGEVLPNAYRNSRLVTGLALKRSADGWVLTGVWQQTAYTESGKKRLTLTAAQDVAAIAKQRQKYKIALATEAKAKTAA